MKHKFSVGQIVNLAPSRLLDAATGEYEVRQLMPASDVSTDSPRYRIKSVAETHERIARESELAATASHPFSRRP